MESCLKGRGEVGWSHGQVSWEIWEVLSSADCCITKTSVDSSLPPPQVFTFGWREDIRVGDPMHTKKVCFDAVSNNSPVTLYDCHGMKGNQFWRYRKVGDAHNAAVSIATL